MILVYSQEPIPPTQATPSIFLVGPTPRSASVPSWRPEAISTLKALGFDGHVFIPEPRDGQPLRDYIGQVEWERQGLEAATAIAAWVCRDLRTLPGFTTNVEFGRYVTSGRLFYGRPKNSPKNKYLDWLYTRETGRVPHIDLAGLLREVVAQSRQC